MEPSISTLGGGGGWAERAGTQTQPGPYGGGGGGGRTLMMTEVRRPAIRQWVEVLPDGTWQVDLIPAGTWTWTPPEGAVLCHVTLIGADAGPGQVPAAGPKTFTAEPREMQIDAGKAGWDTSGQRGQDGLCVIRTRVPDGTTTVTGGATLGP